MPHPSSVAPSRCTTYALYALFLSRLQETLLRIPHVYVAEMCLCEAPRGLRGAVSGIGYASFNLSLIPNSVQLKASEIPVCVVRNGAYGERHLFDMVANEHVARATASRMQCSFAQFLTPMCKLLEAQFREASKLMHQTIDHTRQSAREEMGSKKSTPAQHLLGLARTLRCKGFALLALGEAVEEAARFIADQSLLRWIHDLSLYVSRSMEQLTNSANSSLLEVCNSGKTFDVHGVPVREWANGSRLNQKRKRSIQRDLNIECAHCGDPPLWDLRLDWVAAHPKLQRHPPRSYCHQCWECALNPTCTSPFYHFIVDP